MEDDSEIPPNATVYVKNLEERIKVPALLESLRGIFSEYGEIIDIIAKKSLKRKGQAFIVFSDVESAQNAIDEVNGFELFGKQINCEFAKTQSDATVKRAGTEEDFAQHKRRRLTEKETKQAHEEAEREKTKGPTTEAPTTEKARTGRAAGSVPDEYLPPNNVLIVQGVPDGYDSEAMTAIFGRYAGFQEYNEVPGRKGLAFVHYAAEEGAIEAKNATSGMPIGDGRIKVTYRPK